MPNKCILCITIDIYCNKKASTIRKN